MAKHRFSTGDRVTWRSHGSVGHGRVEEEITSDTEAGGRTVRASAGRPQYLVRSEDSGRTAVHKPGALRRASRPGQTRLAGGRG